ncbi:MAG: hypothetical protein QXQ82_01970 [Candidatus Pacearchaeota archaeon]
MERVKNLTITLGFKDKKKEQEQEEQIKKGRISSVLEQTPLALWVPTFKKLRTKVTEKLEEVTKSIPPVHLPQPKIELQDIRALLSNEKARLLYLIKTKKPDSIYKLAKISGRNFKAVKQDLMLLEKFGLIKFVRIREKKREKLKPVLQVNKLNLSINI